MFTNWRDILKNQKVNPKDQWRCKFFTGLVCHLSGYLFTKLEICHRFRQYIDTGINLEGIVENSEIDGKKSPLQMQFMRRLNQLWARLLLLNTALFQPPLYLKRLRLQIALSIAEEQYNLMCTISHLFLALMVTMEQCKNDIPE